jgi:hypothetical protein
VDDPSQADASARVSSLRRFRGVYIAGLGTAALVAVSVLIASFAPAPFASAAGGARTAAATPCPPPPPPSAAEIEQAHKKFAQQLAQALGKPEAQVAQAMADFEKSLPKPPAGIAKPVVKVSGPDPAMLAPIAAQLGVTPQQLADAMQASEPQLPCPPANAQQGPVAFKLDATQLFEQVAQHLGNGITAVQVKAAFESAGPKVEGVPPPGGFAVSTEPKMAGMPLASLAGALGVTVDQLKAAFDSIAQSSGCPLPPPPSGGNTAGMAGGVVFCMHVGP